MMRRAVKVLGLLALAPILMGGGGINPAPPGAKIAKSPKFRATIVVDPHAAIGDEFGAIAGNTQIGIDICIAAGDIAAYIWERMDERKKLEGK